jgi:hypothetical protein
MRSMNAFAFALVLTYELAYHTITLGLNPFQLVVVGVVLESMTFLRNARTWAVVCPAHTLPGTPSGVKPLLELHPR